MKPDFPTVHNEDGILTLGRLDDGSVDLIVADPPYGLGKDYGNDSDKMAVVEYLQWMEKWSIIARAKLKDSGLFYVFQTWKRSPEVFSMLKTHFIMVNEIIWDRRVPSMGGSTRRFSSVHDNIGVFAKTDKYYFNVDAVRIPYDEETKKARSRSIFVGSKWLELGCNPKDVWSISRLHAIHRERQSHPTQKPLELINRIVLSSSPSGGLVVDPFGGTGTTAASCILNGRRCMMAEINPEYHSMILERLTHVQAPSEVVGDIPAGVSAIQAQVTKSSIVVQRGLFGAELENAAQTVVTSDLLLGMLQDSPRSSDELATALRVSRVVVAKVIFEMKCQGKVISLGRGRGTKYAPARGKDNGVLSLFSQTGQ